MEQCREAMRYRHLSRRTEAAYPHWIRRFIIWRGQRPPRWMGPPEVRGFPIHLTADRNVPVATQNQAIHALLFLYREVVVGELEWQGAGAGQRPAIGQAGGWRYPAAAGRCFSAGRGA